MKIRCIVLYLSLAFSIQCGRGPDIAGSGSGTQTTNGICIASQNGKVSGYVFTVDPEDSLKETPTDTISVSIQLFNSKYQPYDQNGLSMTLVPDSAGRFHCDTALSGNFTMLAYTMKGTAGVFFAGIPINDSVKEFTARKLFAPMGTVSGIIRDSSAMQADYKGAYILGTPFFCLTDSGGAFSFPRVPVGSYTIKADYFAFFRDSTYRRTKGFMRANDTLIICTDSIKVDIWSDSLAPQVKLSL
jgi:hypothetical protein